MTNRNILVNSTFSQLTFCNFEKEKGEIIIEIKRNYFISEHVFIAVTKGQLLITEEITQSFVHIGDISTLLRQ